jgi:2-haloacid dehalogenase
MVTTITPRPEVLSFDCYGTLIDWEKGILGALVPVLQSHGVSLPEDKVLRLYAETERVIEAETYRPYREVLREVVVRMASGLGFRPSGAEVDCLADSIGGWKPFPDTVPALRRLSEQFGLAVISNTDNDIFAQTRQRLEVPFEWIVTAQQVGAYKPSLRPFEEALSRIGMPPDRLLHVAESLFHDIPPAHALGFRTAWINRHAAGGGQGATPGGDVRADYEFPDLAALADALSEGNGAA